MIIFFLKHFFANRISEMVGDTEMKLASTCSTQWSPAHCHYDKGESASFAPQEALKRH